MRWDEKKGKYVFDVTQMTEEEREDLFYEVREIIAAMIVLAIVVFVIKILW